MSLNTLFTEHEIDILFNALNLYSNRCKTNATRKLQGYGKATEAEKRRNWLSKHEDAEKLLSKLSEEAN